MTKDISISTRHWVSFEMKHGLRLCSFSCQFLHENGENYSCFLFNKQLKWPDLPDYQNPSICANCFESITESERDVKDAICGKGF